MKGLGLKILAFSCGLQMILSIVCFVLIVKGIKSGDYLNTYTIGMLGVCVVWSIMNSVFLLCKGEQP